MKKIALILVLSLTFLQASELFKAKDYKQAQMLAKQQNKRIMLFLTSPTCYYCKKMKKSTFKISRVVDRINKYYIFVEVDEYDGVYPEELTVPGVPGTFFLNNDGSKIMRHVLGYWSADDFLSFMDDADRKAKKQQQNKN